MIANFDKSKSLQELEGIDWGDSLSDWDLVRKVNRLRRVPLDDFTAEDLRLMIGQNVGLEYLIPVAIERLQVNPWHPDASHNRHAGDLLRFLLMEPFGDNGYKCRYWKTHPNIWVHAQEVCEQALKLLDTLSDRNVFYVSERPNIGPDYPPSTLELVLAALDTHSFDC